MLRRTILAAAATAALIAPAYAQSLSLIPDGNHRSREEIERDKVIERDYNAATAKIPDKKAPSDPWGNVRSTPSKSSSKSSTAKQQAQ